MSGSIARRRLGAGELIRVGGGTGGQPPINFTWRGRRYRICRIERRQEPIAAEEGGIRRQRWYTVQTAEGMRAVLHQDVSRGQWRMGAVLDREGR